MRRSAVNMATQPTTGDALEHVVATIYPPLGSDGGGLPIGCLVHAEAAVTFGTAGTAATVRLRKGGLAGAVLRTGAIAATGAFMGVLSAFDSNPVGPYVLTVAVTAQTGAGAVTGYLACDQ